MNDERLSAQIAAQLDADVAHFDAATLSRLNQARQRALAVKPRPAWLYVGVAVTACAMLLLASSVFRFADSPVAPAALDQELLAEADIELLEDLEFYAWLEQQEMDPEEFDVREPT